MAGRGRECLAEDGQQCEHSPKTSHGALECAIVMLQNYMLMIFVIKDFVIKKGHYLCQTPV